MPSRKTRPSGKKGSREKDLKKPEDRRSSAAKFLGLPWWLGVGSIAGVVAVAITIWSISSASNDGGGNAVGGHGNIQAGGGSNNCIIQGGTGNSCKSGSGYSPSSHPAASSLSIHTTWPTTHGCDPVTEIAFFPGGPNPGSVKLSNTSDDRVTLTAEGKAVAFDKGHLYITFTVADNSVVQISNIRPVFYGVDSRRPAWIYYPEGGCGGTYGRIFALNLDKRTFTDEGIQGSKVFAAAGDPPPSANELGPSFHVSKSDPAEIEVNATGCNAFYKWGIQIAYVIGNHQYSKTIGSKAEPLLVSGIRRGVVPLYTGSITHPGYLRRAGVMHAASNCHAKINLVQ